MNQILNAELPPWKDNTFGQMNVNLLTKLAIIDVESFNTFMELDNF